MKRMVQATLIGCTLLLAGLHAAAASVTTDITHIISIQVAGGTPVVRLHVYTSGASGAWVDPAGCGKTAYIDIPLDGAGDNAQELINGAYLAMLNHHHVRLQVVDDACSTAGPVRVLAGIQVLDSRHHAPTWPVGDKN